MEGIVILILLLICLWYNAWRRKKECEKRELPNEQAEKKNPTKTKITPQQKETNSAYPEASEDKKTNQQGSAEPFVPEGINAPEEPATNPDNEPSGAKDSFAWLLGMEHNIPMETLPREKETPKLPSTWSAVLMESDCGYVCLKCNDSVYTVKWHIYLPGVWNDIGVIEVPNLKTITYKQLLSLIDRRVPSDLWRYLEPKLCDLDPQVQALFKQ